VIRFDRMRILTEDGVIDTLVLDDETASMIGRYWNAVRRYQRMGDARDLERFEGESVNFHRLLTDPDVIDDWDRVGELELPDSIYVNPS
jgi:hypothetical protein